MLALLVSLHLSWSWDAPGSILAAGHLALATPLLHPRTGSPLLAASAPSLLEQIEETVRSDQVVVYSKTTCPYCERTKALFERLEVPVKMIELDLLPGSDGSDLQLALAEKTGQRTVPNVFINGEHLGGNDDTQAAFRAGELQAMLGFDPPSDGTGAKERLVLPRRNLLLASASPVAAVALYSAQRANPVDSLKLLNYMRDQSPSLPAALQNGRPTLVEFYAPWCESCRLMAKDMLRLEKQYGERLNFVVVDGDDPQNAPIVRAFAVDGIPHFAFISPERKLQATLVGQVPDKVMQRQLEAFATRGELPYGT